jgi:hypothetical protein
VDGDGVPSRELAVESFHVDAGTACAVVLAVPDEMHAVETLDVWFEELTFRWGWASSKVTIGAGQAGPRCSVRAVVSTKRVHPEGIMSAAIARQ